MTFLYCPILASFRCWWMCWWICPISLKHKSYIFQYLPMYFESEFHPLRTISNRPISRTINLLEFPWVYSYKSISPFSNLNIVLKFNLKEYLLLAGLLAVNPFSIWKTCSGVFYSVLWCWTRSPPSPLIYRFRKS